MTHLAKKISVTSLIICLFQLFAFAQSPERIMLDKQYYGSLDQVLDRISLEKNILFTFNKHKLSTVNVDENTVNQPLDKLLNRWCLISKLEWYQGTDHIINIVGKTELRDPLVQKWKSIKHSQGSHKTLIF